VFAGEKIWVVAEKQIVAYLDLLAFSNHVRENTRDALGAFTTYQTILTTKIRDGLIYPADSYPDERLREIATRNSITSFKYFLPFSDSIFILSDDPNCFVKQLGAFVLHCFTFTSREYEQPDDLGEPTRVTHKFDDQTKLEENWWPALFRGGIGLGEASPIELVGLVEGKPQTIANLAGKGVVKAVSLESKIKGPRIIFEKELFDQLNESTKVYTAETEIKNYYEILWPGFNYIPTNGYSEINDFGKLFLPAVNLWKAYNHTPYSEHYFRFIELVVTGTLKVFEEMGELEAAIEKIKEEIKEQGLEHKTNQLLKSYS